MLILLIKTHYPWGFILPQCTAAKCRAMLHSGLTTESLCLLQTLICQRPARRIPMHETEYWQKTTLPVQIIWNSQQHRRIWLLRSSSCMPARHAAPPIHIAYQSMLPSSVLSVHIRIPCKNPSKDQPDITCSKFQIKLWRCRMTFWSDSYLHYKLLKIHASNSDTIKADKITRYCI